MEEQFDSRKALAKVISAIEGEDLPLEITGQIVAILDESMNVDPAPVALEKQTRGGILSYGKDGAEAHSVAVSRISNKLLFKAIRDQLFLVILVPGTALKLVVCFLKIASDLVLGTYEHITGDDASLLLSIVKMDQTRFLYADVQTFHKGFGLSPLTDEQIQQGLERLTGLHILRKVGEEFEVVESFVPVRN